MEYRIVWATIDPNGNVLASSEQLQVVHTAAGTYVIKFETPFGVLPTVVGSQVLFGASNQNPIDNVVFPYVDQSEITAITGDAVGNHTDRHFAFTAFGV